MPKLLLICGPNGAGKSTAREYGNLESELPVLDTDRLARESGLSPIAAGKESANQVRNLLAADQSFGRESTMTARFDEEIIRQAKQRGYDVELIYIGLSGPGLAIKRVAERVADGGHAVPPEDVKRRYLRGLERLPVMLGTVDLAHVYDNTQNNYRLVLEVVQGKASCFENTPLPAWLGKALGMSGQLDPALIGLDTLNQRISSNIARRVEMENGLGL